MRILYDLLEAIFPFRCHVCQAETSFGTVLCQGCEKKLGQALRPPVAFSDTVCEFPVFTLSEYDAMVADVIRLIKYRPSKKLIRFIEKAIVKQNLLLGFASSADIFIPVPMHRARRDERGFNQAEEFAGIMAHACGARFSPALERVVATIPQASCSEEERLTNLDRAISLAPGLIPSMFQGKRLILVDDVATTGTTLDRCHKQLSRLHPASIEALVVSHSYRRNADS